jgi:putative endonuclease
LNSGKDKKTVVKGQQYEKLAAKFLTENGHEIIEKNWRAGRREIDLIAVKDKTVVFVEVKGATSQKFGHPSERVDTKKQDNLIKAAEQYIIAKDLDGYDYRFDLITFLDGNIEHYPNAFQIDSA